MKSILRVILLLGLLTVLFASVVSAQEEAAAGAEEEDPFDQDEFNAQTYGGVRTDFTGGALYYARTIFPNHTASSLTPRFHAGAPATAVIAYQNLENTASHRVFLVAAYLQPHNNYGMILQNFSVVRQGRSVDSSETVTFHYTFTPDAGFEPGNYNLVVGVFYANSNTNNSLYVPAFNGTVYIDEPLGTDPRTVLTYLTLIIIVGAIAYYLADRFGIVKMIQASRRSNAGAPRQDKRVEVGTRGSGYDPDYVSEEHMRYREDVLRRSSASPGSRKASASPKKKN